MDGDRQSRILLLLKTLLSVGLAVYILSRIEFDDLLALRNDLSSPWMVIYFFFSLVSILVMTLRYQVLLGGQVRYPRLLPLVMRQTAVGNLFATSAGAVTYVGLLKQEHNLPVVQGIQSLVIAKVWDFWFFLTLFSATGLAVWGIVQDLQLLVLAAAVSSLVLLALLVAQKRSLGIVLKLRQRFFSADNRLVKWADDLLQDNAAADRSRLIIVALSSALTIATMLASYIASYKALSLPLGLLWISFVAGAIQIIGVLPVQISGGLGVYDVTELFFLEMFGLPTSDAAAFVVGKRVMFYLFNLSLLLILTVIDRGSNALPDGQ